MSRSESPSKHKPLPGYAGFVPKSDQEILPYKTALNLRMPLDSRIEPVQASRRAQSQPSGEDPREKVRCYFLPKRHVGLTTYTAQTREYIHSAADIPHKATEPVTESNTAALPPFTAHTERRSTTKTSSGLPDNFYSSVRKIEKADDDARRNVTVAPTRSGAAHNLRTVDIMRKRENDPALAPPKEAFFRVQRRPPNGLPPPPASETVKLTPLPSHPSYEVEFPNPTARMSNLVDTATHVPISKLMTKTGTTKDMFAGTAKIRDDVIVGYQGHVPANKTNVARIKAEQEILRAFSKCSVRLSAQPAAVPGYAGYCPDRSEDMDLTNVPSTQNRANHVAVDDIGHERTMNTRNGTGRKNAVRGFFTVGTGQQDSLIADQFCVRYRPLEGVMKMGPVDSRNWIGDKELRRSVPL